ncbi:protease complex subunit PrcB family protein [Anaeromicrobium sediminis]|uniref:PrcB C-terminal domain-containing protein n=1 Tax=Anaeromicrobium sediminis TaxID=1478221 RepID=A0A267MCZ5_9FIRM|nr:protease complex subunit PrcB family protein [Anaeromicrobium sediminis]PAB57252.1 hypothetical protein CCE28_19400 [Anaeromicrobium sediminis]
MKKTLLIIGLILLSTVLVFGCFKDKSKNNPLAYTQLKMEKLSNEEQLSKWILNNKDKEGLYSEVINGQTYLLIVGSTQNTVGYNIHLKDLYSDDDYLYVDYSIIEPPKDSVVTTALDNPFLVAKLKGKPEFQRAIKF